VRLHPQSASLPEIITAVTGSAQCQIGHLHDPRGAGGYWNDTRSVTCAIKAALDTELIGQPTMRPEETKNDHRVWLYLPPDTHRKVKAVAAADDRSVANWLRRMVEQRLRSEQTAA